MLDYPKLIKMHTNNMDLFKFFEIYNENLVF